MRVHRWIPSFLVCIAFAALAAGCGDDDDDDVDVDRAEPAAGGVRSPPAEDSGPSRAAGPPQTGPRTTQMPDIPAFRDHDGDRNGSLEDAEFAAWIGEDGVHASWVYEAGGELDCDRVAERLIRFWDADGDSLISEQEFVSGLRMWYGTGEPGSFGDWDGNGDRGLDAVEVSGALRARGMYETIDRDGSSLVDDTELAAWLFAVVDTSNDGSIDVDEWNAAVERGWIG